MAKLPLLPSLVVSAKRSVWRMHDHSGEGDKQFQQVRKPVLEAANYSCQFCGFQSSKYQEVHHLNDDHNNNDRRNLACTCPLCHQVFHIGLAGMRDGGEIIYLPELTQAELNQLSLIMWLVTENEATQFKGQAERQAFERLKNVAKVAEGLLGTRRGHFFLRLKQALESTDFPPEFLANDMLKPLHLTLGLFSNVLMALPDDVYGKREDLLGGLRLLPSPTRFQERIIHWSAEQGGILPAPAWYKIVSAEDVESIIITCMKQFAEIAPKVQKQEEQ